jgi:hypothetical protein
MSSVSCDPSSTMTGSCHLDRFRLMAKKGYLAACQKKLKFRAQISCRTGLDLSRFCEPGNANMNVLWAILLVVVLAAGWVLNLFGLPGNWLNVAAAVCYAWLFPAGQRLSVSWWVVSAVLLLAVAGEVLELVAGAAGARRLGGSRRSAVLALAGSWAPGKGPGNRSGVFSAHRQRMYLDRSPSPRGHSTRCQ